MQVCVPSALPAPVSRGRSSTRRPAAGLGQDEQVSVPPGRVGLGQSPGGGWVGLEGRGQAGGGAEPGGVCGQAQQQHRVQAQEQWLWAVFLIAFRYAHLYTELVRHQSDFLSVPPYYHSLISVIL